MKPIYVAFLLLCLIAGSAMGTVASRFEPVLRPNVRIGLVDVGGLTPEQARYKLRVWWETEKRRELVLRHESLRVQPKPRTFSQLGLRLDDVASVASIPVEDFWENAGRQVGLGESEAKVIQPVFTLDESKVKSLKQEIESANAGQNDARAFWRGGAVAHRREGASVEVDESKLSESVLRSIQEGTEVTLPLKQGAKRVPDEDLLAIDTRMASFSTKFNAGQRDRSHNIKLAAEKIDGLVLMPGEEFSFNKVVGERSSARGFRLAGVYVNGRHDVDIGGGICQVSTTLYNAILLAGLQPTNRSCHSLPVPYVSIGRDAAVSYGSLDFRFRNNTPHAVAVSASVNGGEITFSVLGRDKPQEQVKIVLGSRQVFTHEPQVKDDPSLPYGKEVVIEKGSPGYSITSARVFYVDGKEIRRESLGTSRYRGGPRIVAKNLKAKPPAGAVTTPATPLPDVRRVPLEEPPQAIGAATE